MTKQVKNKRKKRKIKISKTSKINNNNLKHNKLLINQLNWWNLFLQNLMLKVKLMMSKVSQLMKKTFKIFSKVLVDILHVNNAKEHID